jgi:uncharacterized membrane protein YfhO
MTYKAIITGNDDIVVFSEIFYKASGQEWFAYIDGEKTEFIRVNYLLRGLKVPVGEHEIVFKFEPQTYFKGEVIDLSFSILLLLTLAGAIGLELRKRNKGEDPKEAA